jgi:hypothetical protein
VGTARLGSFRKSKFGRRCDSGNGKVGFFRKSRFWRSCDSGNSKVGFVSQIEIRALL